MGEIIPVPVWIIPFPVLKINFELLGKNKNHFVKEVFHQRYAKLKKANSLSVSESVRQLARACNVPVGRRSSG